VLTSCADLGCLASAVAATDGGAATLNLDNPSEFPLTRIVSVSGTTTVGGAFNLTGTTTPLTDTRFYRYSAIPAACDDVAMGTAVAPMAGWTDDSATAIAALPFPFRFFTSDVTHYSVTSNGYAQLWPSMMGTPSTAYSNIAIPGTGTPDNFVAPFWDDLVPVDAMTTGARVATLGTMPNRRFVIQWTNWEHISASGMDALTFQAKLFETTGIIEFHYCALTPANETNTGLSTTVGAEDFAGVTDGGAQRGNLITFNTAGRIATTTAFRLAPP
jgi:hypothetical protein